MFSVGQRVWSRDGKRSGRVIESDGDRVYIEQDNGAELDLSARDLTTVAPGGAAGGAVKVASASLVRRLTPRDITPEHVRVLSVVPVRTLQAIAAVFERQPGAGKFSALDTAEKLNVITDITAIPFRTMQAYSDRPGELGLLMGKGLADSSKATDRR
jgi:hypothetical protein